MKKDILFFTDAPPEEKQAVHIWLGKAKIPHEQHLCKLIGEYLDGPPAHLAVGPTGKPYLPGAPIHFNLSDSEDWLAIAFSWEAPVGIDIEAVRPLDGMQDVISNCFSFKEQVYVQEKDSLIRFWEIWNRKEASCKALGLGLQDNMADWECLGNGWISVKGTWVRSIHKKRNLSIAVAICE